MNTVLLPLTPWVATIPLQWQVRRLGTVADIILSNVDKHTLEGELPVRLCNYTDVYKNDRITAAIEFMLASALPREIEKFQLREGDVLATKDSEAPNDIAVAAVVAEELPGVLCGYHLAIIRPDQRQLYGFFLSWVHSSKQIRAQYEAQAVGVTRFAIGQAAFKEVYIPLPPISEQRRIVAYLDEQTEKIDRLMDMRRRQMALLKEQRSALIQQAVTRGLNPNVPMKDSGLPWLGEIPEHWTLTRAKFISDIFVPQRNKPELNEIEGFYWVTMDEMTQSEIYSATYKVSQLALSATGSRLLPQGSVIASCVGNFGVASVNKVPVVINQQLQAFIPYRISAEFLRLIVSLSAPYFEMIATAATLEYVNQAGFANLSIPLPPKGEQAEIIEFVASQNAQFETLHAAYNRQLTLLTEYRAALIHECVIGQRLTPEAVSP